MRILIHISGLSEERKRVLCALYLLRFIRFEHNFYNQIMMVENIDTLNDLLELGWVQYSPSHNDPENNLMIHLHSLVAEMISLDLKPDTIKFAKPFMMPSPAYREQTQFSPLQGERM